MWPQLVIFMTRETLHSAMQRLSEGGKQFLLPSRQFKINMCARYYMSVNFKFYAEAKGFGQEYA